MNCKIKVLGLAFCLMLGHLATYGQVFKSGFEIQKNSDGQLCITKTVYETTPSYNNSKLRLVRRFWTDGQYNLVHDVVYDIDFVGNAYDANKTLFTIRMLKDTRFIKDNKYDIGIADWFYLIAQGMLGGKDYPNATIKHALFLDKDFIKKTKIECYSIEGVYAKLCFENIYADQSFVVVKTDELMKFAKILNEANLFNKAIFQKELKDKLKK